MNPFEFATATHILFERDALKKVAPIVQIIGKRIFLVTGQNPDRVSPLKRDLEASHLSVEVFSVNGEPTVDAILNGVEAARQFRSDVVIGMGGGSPVDAGKAIAAMVTNTGDLMEYLEVIGQGKHLSNRPVPYIAIPTTSGTGAEVTRNAVIGAQTHRVKVSMRSPMMLPALAVVDPLLTVSMSKETTANTGLDALTQVIEPFVSHQSNPLTDGLCREGMKRAARSLKKAYENGDDVDAREEMCVTSLFGGLALANAKLGAVHGFAGPLGGMFNAPHGAICAKLLSPVIAANVEALSERAPTSPSLSRFDEVGQILTGKPNATAKDAQAWIAELCDALNLQSLGTFGITEAHIPDIVVKSKNASSMKGNPIPLTEEELSDILKRAI